MEREWESYRVLIENLPAAPKNPPFFASLNCCLFISTKVTKATLNPKPVL